MNIFKFLVVLCSELGENEMELILTKNYKQLSENISSNLKNIFEKLVKSKKIPERKCIFFSIIKCLVKKKTFLIFFLIFF